MRFKENTVGPKVYELDYEAKIFYSIYYNYQSKTKILKFLRTHIKNVIQFRNKLQKELKLKEYNSWSKYGEKRYQILMQKCFSNEFYIIYQENNYELINMHNSPPDYNIIFSSKNFLEVMNHGHKLMIEDLKYIENELEKLILLEI